MWKRFLQLFGKKENPTLGWSSKPGQHLTVDLSSLSICGVHLNDPIHSLSTLGPATLHSIGHWIWPELGLGIEVASTGFATPINVIHNYANGSHKNCETHESQLILRGFCVFLGNPLSMNIDVAPYSGEFILGGHRIMINSMSSESDLIALLGSPYFRSEEDQLLLFYEQANGELVASLEWITDSEGALTHLLAQTPRLLDQPAARTYYGLNS